MTQVRHVARLVSDLVPTDVIKRQSRVRHYSIPAYDESGGARTEPGQSIESAKKAVRNGDVLIARLNPHKSRVQIVSDVGGDLTVASSEFVVLRPFGASSRYLAHLLRAPSTQQALEAEVRSATRSQRRVEARHIAHLEVPVTDAVGQERVVAHLDRLGRRVEALNSALEAYRAVATEAYMRDLRDGVGLDGAPAVLLRMVAAPGSGHTPSRSRSDYWVEDERTLPWFTLADVHQIRDDRRETVSATSQHLSPVGLANSAAVLHPKGTVLLSRTASVGFSAVMDRDMAVSQDFVTWTCGPALLSDYLLFVLRAIRPELLGLMVGSTHKTIYMPDLLGLRVPLPPADEQAARVAHLRQKLARHWALRERLDGLHRQLVAYRASVTQEAVEGHIAEVRSTNTSSPAVGSGRVASRIAELT